MIFYYLKSPFKMNFNRKENNMDLKNIKTKDLIDELVARGAELIENELYQDNKICVCRTKYSKDDDVEVLGRVLVLEDVE